MTTSIYGMESLYVRKSYLIGMRYNPVVVLDEILFCREVKTIICVWPNCMGYFISYGLDGECHSVGNRAY